MRSAILSLIALVSINAQEGLLSYRLHFSISETGQDQKTATRRYDILAGNRSRAKINASRRIPYYTATSANKNRDVKELHTAALGTIIGCTPIENGSGVQLGCDFESSFVVPNQPAPPAGFLPVTIARQVSTTVMVELGKQQQIALLDDPASGTRVEIAVMVERLPVR